MDGWASETIVVSLDLSDVPGGSPPRLVKTPVEHLGEQFAAIALRHSTQIALQSGRRQVTYAEVLSAACAVRDRLRGDFRFETNARVALLLPNSLEYIASFYGVLLSGGIVVPLPPDVESSRLEAILESTAATHLLTAPPVVARRSDLRGRTVQTFRPSEPSSLPVEATSAASDPELADLAAIFFTAGSSGTPKGVMLTHRNLISNALEIQQYKRLTAAERPLCVLPFYHAFGNSVLQSHLLTGARIVLEGNPLFPESIVTALQQHEATSLSAVPDLLRFVLDRTSLGRTPLPSLRYMAVAGGALPVALCQQLAGRIAPAEFFVMYGQTEATARLSYLPPERLTSHAGSIGRGLPGVKLQIVDENGRVLPPGEIGELCARGPNIMRGYWRDPEGTREVLRDGWLWTGDLGTADADGWIFLKGRRSAFLKIAGHRIHPGELENFVTSRWDGAQAVAVPFESRAGGTRLALYVVPAVSTAEITPSEVLAGCRMSLPRPLIPDHVQMLDELPLNHALKIDRPLLTRWAQRDLSQSAATA